MYYANKTKFENLKIFENFLIIPLRNVKNREKFHLTTCLKLLSINS